MAFRSEVSSCPPASAVHAEHVAGPSRGGPRIEAMLKAWTGLLRQLM